MKTLFVQHLPHPSPLHCTNENICIKSKINMIESSLPVVKSKRNDFEKRGPKMVSSFSSRSLGFFDLVHNRRKASLANQHQTYHVKCCHQFAMLYTLGRAKQVAFYPTQQNKKRRHVLFLPDTTRRGSLNGFLNSLSERDSSRYTQLIHNTRTAHACESGEDGRSLLDAGRARGMSLHPL